MAAADRFLPVAGPPRGARSTSPARPRGRSGVREGAGIPGVPAHPRAGCSPSEAKEPKRHPRAPPRTPCAAPDTPAQRGTSRHIFSRIAAWAPPR
ncbi:hypothetical protein GCM10027187_55420 [Streptosporangium sandarakinum]